MRSDEVWFVTGASSGLGSELAIAAAAAGATVVASARRIDRLLDLAEAHERIVPIHLDVTEAVGVERAVNGVIDEYGFIDVVVNGAGRTEVGPVEEGSDAALRSLMEVNFFGAVAVTRAALPHMRQRRSGTIVQISSVLGVVGQAGSSACCASRFALNGWSEALAQEVEPFGLRVLVVEPGDLRIGTAEDSPEEARAEGHRTDQSEVHAAPVSDPVRVAEAVLDVLAGPEPPLHLLAGSDAVQMTGARLGTRLESDRTWRLLSRSTDLR